MVKRAPASGGVPMRVLFVALAFATVVAGVGVALSGTASAVVRVASATALPTGYRSLGARSSGSEMRVSIALEPADPSALHAEAEAVADPSSPQYHHFLSPSEATAEFGASPAEIAAVSNWAIGEGLSVGAIAGDGTVLPLSGTTAAVGRAFSTSFEDVRSSSGVTGYANDRSAEVPAALGTSVLGVVGLNSLQTLNTNLVQRPASRRRAVARAKQAGTVQPHVGELADSVPAECSTMSRYLGETTASLASIYDMDDLYETDGLTGAGITVALLEGGTSFSLSGVSTDVTAFESCYGASTSISQVAVDGGCPDSESDCSMSPEQSGSAAEERLDIDAVVALAPQASIKVYEAPDLSNQSLYDDEAAAIDGDAQIISISLGECEPDSKSADVSEGNFASAENTEFELASTQGESVFVASGDLGSEGCVEDGSADSASYLTQLAVEDPGSQPFVTSVGGTSIRSSGGSTTESVWDDGPVSKPSGNLVTTGGISQIWQMPSYQDSVADGLSSNSPCNISPDCREVPDVSASADTEDDNGFLFLVNCSTTSPSSCSVDYGGGTSVAAPLWASIAALFDQQDCSSSPAHFLGFLNPDLYAASSGFNEVTSGNNDYLKTPLSSSLSGGSANETCGPTGPGSGPCYQATAGYNMATGLGSPEAAVLMTQIDPAGLNVSSCTLPGADAGEPYSTTLTASGGSGGYQWMIPSGEQLPGTLSLASSGVLSGTAPSQSGQSASFNVEVQDSDTETATATLSLTTNAEPVVGTTTLTPVDAEQPIDVALSVSGGSAPYAWSTGSTSLPAGLGLSPNGSLIGKVSAGTFTFDATVTDGNQQSASQSLTLTVNPLPSVATSSLSAADLGTQIDDSLEVSGGTGPFSWSSTGGLPAGLEVSSGGLLSGSPQNEGTFAVGVEVTDADSQSASRTVSVTVNPSPSISTDSLPGAVVGTAYSATLSEAGGTSPLVWSVADGQLPPGLSLSSSGSISGTPTEAMVDELTVGLSDAAGAYTSAVLTINVAGAPVAATSSSSSSSSSASSSAPSSTSSTKASATKPTVIIASASLAMSGGTVPVTISCAKAKCVGVVTITTTVSTKVLKKGKATIVTSTLTLGRVSYHLARGARATFKVTLSASARAKVAAAGKRGIVTTVSVTVSGGSRAKKSARLT